MKAEFNLNNDELGESYDRILNDCEYGYLVENFVTGLPKKVVDSCNLLLDEQKEYDVNNIRLENRRGYVLCDTVDFNGIRYCISLDMVVKSLLISKNKLVDDKIDECYESLVLYRKGYHNDIDIFDTQEIGEYYSSVYSFKNTYFLYRNLKKNNGEVNLMRETKIIKNMDSFSKKKKRIAK